MQYSNKPWFDSRCVVKSSYGGSKIWANRSFFSFQVWKDTGQRHLWKDVALALRKKQWSVKQREEVTQSWESEKKDSVNPALILTGINWFILSVTIKTIPGISVAFILWPSLPWRAGSTLEKAWKQILISSTLFCSSSTVKEIQATEIIFEIVFLCIYFYLEWKRWIWFIAIYESSSLLFVGCTLLAHLQLSGVIHTRIW